MTCYVTYTCHGFQYENRIISNIFEIIIHKSENGPEWDSNLGPTTQSLLEFESWGLRWLSSHHCVAEPIQHILKHHDTSQDKKANQKRPTFSSKVPGFCFLLKGPKHFELSTPNLWRMLPKTEVRSSEKRSSYDTKWGSIPRGHWLKTLFQDSFWLLNSSWKLFGSML